MFSLHVFIIKEQNWECIFTCVLYSLTFDKCVKCHSYCSNFSRLGVQGHNCHRKQMLISLFSVFFKKWWKKSIKECFVIFQVVLTKNIWKNAAFSPPFRLENLIGRFLKSSGAILSPPSWPIFQHGGIQVNNRSFDIFLETLFD